MRNGTAWDLAGKTCMITGATGGIGRAAAEALAAEGAELVLVCRDASRARALCDELRDDTGNERIEPLIADLSSQQSVREAAATFLASGRPLHVLLNNAGVVMLARTETVDGIETTFAVNHLGYFLLTNLLLDRLRASAPARVVCVASDAHRFAGGRIALSDLEGRKSYAAMRNYGMSKLANILFVRELARRLEGTEVTVNALHPGMVATGLGRNNGLVARVVTTVLRPFSRSPASGADTAVYLCASPEVASVSGKYFADRREVHPNDAALNDEDAHALWAISERMTRVDEPTSPA